MAEAKRGTAPAAGQVAVCAATDCRHNERRACTAPAVHIEMRGGVATCGTYESETPKARP